MSEEKKQRFSELLKYIRGNDGVKKFAARLEIKLPTYSAWEMTRAFPSQEIWEILLPKLCDLSGFTPDLIDRYLRGDYELIDLAEGAAQAGLPPRSRGVMTVAKFRGWLQTLALPELVQVLKDTVDRAAELASQQPEEPLSEPQQTQHLPHQGSPDADLTDPPSPVRKQPERYEESLESFSVGAIDEEAVVRIICQLADTLSLERIVQVDNRLRDLIFLKLQELGLLEMKKYQHNPFYLLMEQYRINHRLSYEQFEERLLREGRDAGIEPSRIAKIVRGQLLPDDRELIWIGVFIRKPDGSLYEHEELVALRDGLSQSSSEDMKSSDFPLSHFSIWGEQPGDREINDETFGLNGR